MRKERKRTEHSFFRTEKNETYRTEKNGVPNPEKQLLSLIGEKNFSFIDIYIALNPRNTIIVKHIFKNILGLFREKNF